MKTRTTVKALICSICLASVAFFPVSAAGQTCPDGIISYWSLNENGGTTFTDGPGSNNANCTVCPTSISSGRIGRAQNFNGVDQEVNVPSNSSFNFGSNDSFSLEIWYRATDTGATTEVFMGRTDDFNAGMQWFIGRTNSGRPRVDIKDSNDNLVSLADSDIPTSGVWHHVVGVRNASTDTVLLYVDGNLVNSSGDNFSGNFNSGSANIGIGHLLSTVHFAGDLDEAAIYDRALTADEVFLHHANGVTFPQAVCFSSCEAPVVLPTFQPEEMQRECEGGALSLEVQSIGSPPLSYQWFQDGAAVPGGTSRVLNIFGGTEAMSGSYTVEVSNSCGSDESEPGILVFDAGPTMDLHPVDTTACEGGNALLIIEAGPVTTDYQWFHDGVPIPGDFEPQLLIQNVSLDDAGVYTVTVFNECGSIDSLPATLTVIAAPSITDPPDDVSACEGDPVTFTVAATGSGELSYEWFKDAELITGAVDSTLTLPGTIADDAGIYQVRVTDDCSQVLSDPATLTLDVGGPQITEEPVDQGACEGDEVVFSVAATGSEPLTFQWSKDGNDINGATDATLVIASATADDAGDYQVTINDGCGRVAETDAKSLSVFDQASITDQPDDANACAGDAIVLSVSATGAPLTFQWQRDGEDIPGAIDDTYVIGEARVADTGEYRVLVTGDCGPIESDVASVIVETTPEIASQTGDVDACNGDTINFNVTLAAVGPTTTYQWQKDGADIGGATSANYTIDNASESDAGTYQVVVSSDCGNVTSDPMIVQFGVSGPVISEQPASQSVCEGDPATMTVVTPAASGFQWYKDDAAISGATSQELAIAAVSPADVGAYHVVLSSDCGETTSEKAQLTISDGPECFKGVVFKRGDTNGNGGLDIGDPILNLGHQFLGNAVLCRDALDFNDSGNIDISDPVANLSHQFLGLAPPAPPGKTTCGIDETPDASGIDLGCEVYDNC